MSGRSIQSWKRSRGSNAAPAPRLIPAETKNQPRTNIESGTANGGTSHPRTEKSHEFLEPAVISFIACRLASLEIYKIQYRPESDS